MRKVLLYGILPSITALISILSAQPSTEKAFLPLRRLPFLSLKAV